MGRKILVPVDLSEDSEIVLERARKSARGKDQIIVCHVVLDPSEFAGFYIPHLSTDQSRKELLEEARKELKAFMESNAPEASSRLEIGVPFREILRVDEEEGVDLIVIGSHKQGATAHLFVSHASEKVIREAQCDVLVIPLKVESEEDLVRRRSKLRRGKG